MTYQIFKYVKSGQFGSRHILYQLEGINNKKTIIIGIRKLTRMYKEGRIKGYLPDTIKVKLGLPRRKTRSDKKVESVEPVTVKNHWLENKPVINNTLPNTIPPDNVIVDEWECWPIDKL